MPSSSSFPSALPSALSGSGAFPAEGSSPQRFSLLGWVCHMGDVDAARALLRIGLDPNPALVNPGLSPLSSALRFTPELVPDLLAAGARPFHGSTGCEGDLAIALQGCPEHVPALLAHGADPWGLETMANPLLPALRACMANPLQPHAWSALAALAEAGADFRVDLRSEAPLSQGDVAWFELWGCRFMTMGEGAPNGAQALLDTLVERMPDPGWRHRGMTFLHAIADTIPKLPDRPAAEQQWKEVLARYPAEDLSAWVHQEGTMNGGVLQRSFQVRPANGTQWTGDDSLRLAACLTTAHRWFAPLGAGGNELDREGRTAANALAGNALHSWSALSDHAVQAAVRAWGLDFQATRAWPGLETSPGAPKHHEQQRLLQALGAAPPVESSSLPTPAPAARGPSLKG